MSVSNFGLNLSKGQLSVGLYNRILLSTRYYYCPTARRKTLSMVASNRRVEERRNTDIKSIATFGNLRALPLGEECVFERSTKRNEASAGSTYTK
ncbi:hypothetical protein AVEN_60863-1 [Araneus ventricosus]|uniref:Uncharacterized protein n=1 Tax=Araneus ventricosus TaxID=182803 RepID=A0A4Y2INI9_ARAVE|nr:hypothetical protein AVEN_60863-1 [Araneus ventricosus]